MLCVDVADNLLSIHEFRVGRVALTPLPPGFAQNIEFIRLSFDPFAKYSIQKSYMQNIDNAYLMIERGCYL